MIWLIVSISALFVYYDATKNKIGKITEEKSGILNSSAEAWAITTLLLWIVAFPLYLINRSKLIEKAKQHPQEVGKNKRRIVLGVITVLVFLFLLNGVFLTSSVKSSVEKSAKPLVTQILHEKLGANETIQCVAVKLGEEFAKNNYHAVGILNNGNNIRITVQLDKDQIFVNIPLDQ